MRQWSWTVHPSVPMCYLLDRVWHGVVFSFPIVFVLGLVACVFSEQRNPLPRSPSILVVSMRGCYCFVEDS